MSRRRLAVECATGIGLGAVVCRFTPAWVQATLAIGGVAVVGWWFRTSAVRCSRRAMVLLGLGRDQGGSAVLEAMLGMGFMVLPMTFLLTTTAWPSRLNAASAAAYQAAKTVAEAPDPVTGEDLGRQRAVDVMANHGFDPGSIAVSYSTPDPQRGDQVTATVTVTLPALSFPTLGSWDAVDWDRSATVEVPGYRSFE